MAAAFGGTVAAGVPNPDNGGCDYEITGTTKTGDSGILTQVSINLNGQYESYDREKVIFPDVEKVDGLGSEAWYYAVGSQSIRAAAARLWLVREITSRLVPRSPWAILAGGEHTSLPAALLRTLVAPDRPTEVQRD